MTAVERVRRTQRSLELVIGSSILFWACAALLGLLAIGASLSALVALPAVFRAIIPIVSLLAALATLGVLAWRGRFAWSFDRVALWIEERAPELRYALVTAIDPRYQGATAQLMDRVISRVDTGPFVRTAAKRSTLPAAVAFLVMLGVFLAIPNTWKKRLDARGFVFPSAKAIVGNRLIPLSGTVTAPSYANLAIQKFTEPSTITGLVGSRVVITGHGDPAGIDISMEEIPSGDTQEGLRGDPASDDTTKDTGTVVPSGVKSAPHKRGTPPPHPAPSLVKKLTVISGGNGWITVFTLADSNPALLKLVDRQYHRSIVIDPRVDQPPEGRLLLPVRDTTLRVPTGTLNLSAIFNDDIGLAKARFDYIKCSSATDDPENVKCIQGTYGTHAFSGTRTGDFSMAIPFASFKYYDDSGRVTLLKEGDQLSVRGVVFDNKPAVLGGPDSGVTESHTIRIARKSEYEKLSVNPAPPSADTALISLRMLLIAVKHLDSLYNVQHAIAADRYTDSCGKLSGVAQDVLHKIDFIIKEQTGDGEVDVDPRLQVAKDSMTSGQRDLAGRATHPAIPPLVVAYDKLKEYSDIARYYLRGKIDVPLVNIDRVRLTGDAIGRATPRTPRQVSNMDRIRYLRTYVLAVQQMRSSPDSAAEALTILRVETLRKYPELAQVIGDAVTAIQTKKDPASPLLRARRMLEGSAAALDTLPLWSGAW